jgi:hypothetical protein
MRGSPANDHDCTDIWSVIGILTDLKGFLSKSFQDPCTRAPLKKTSLEAKKVCKVLDSHYFWKTTFLPSWDTMTLNMQPELPTHGQPCNISLTTCLQTIKVWSQLPNNPTTSTPPTLNALCNSWKASLQPSTPWGLVCSRTRSYWVQCLAPTNRQ